MRDDTATSDAEWRDRLSPEAYRVLRRGGTERAFSHPMGAAGAKATGVARCAGCDAPLFDAAAKFDSGTGWPSFFAPVNASAIHERNDRSLFMRRTEILCAQCGGHLGHVFPDGPEPTGRRYCVNGVALKFSNEGHDGDAER